MAHDVFISYSSKDKTVADAVCAVLEKGGTRCWIAPRDVRPGMPYGEAIIEAIHGANVMVLVFSSHANASGHIPKEVERAVSKGLTIIPFRIQDVMPGRSLDYFIGSVHWLDAMTPPLEAHLEKLARTVEAIVPTGTRDVSKVSLNSTIAATSPPASVIQEKQKIALKPLWIGVAALVLALVLIGIFLFRSTTEVRLASSNNVPGAPQSSQPPLPAPTQPTRSAPVQPRPSQPAAPARPAVSPEAAGIAGCWNWLNNALLVAREDGSVLTGTFTGRWQSKDPVQRIYTITWPKAVDTITLSPDGSRLEGGNQYGFATSGTRQSPIIPGSLAGVWRWFNGVTIVMDANGTLQAGPIVAKWRPTDNSGRAFAITWPEPVDTLTLSPDGQRVAGSNQYGVGVGGTRRACPN